MSTTLYFESTPISNYSCLMSLMHNVTEITNFSGIHSRIELAMDLVKLHLTSAVKEEIITLKSQIEKLNERCSRLEQENNLLRQHVNPELIPQIDNRLSFQDQTNPHQQIETQSNVERFIITKINSNSTASSTNSSSNPPSIINTNNSSQLQQSSMISPSTLSENRDLNTSDDSTSAHNISSYSSIGTGGSGGTGGASSSASVGYNTVEYMFNNSSTNNNLIINSNILTNENTNIPQQQLQPQPQQHTDSPIFKATDDLNIN